MKILVLNAGSSSQKSALYELNEDTPLTEPSPPMWEAKIDWAHQRGVAEIDVKTPSATIRKEGSASDRLHTIAQMLQTLWSGETQIIQSAHEIDAVGHRIVHGGEQYRESVLITPDVKAAIDQLSTFAPTHNPANLEGIVAIEQILDAVPQVAVFDTAFHAQIPPESSVYPIPYEWYEKGIRRYGFHGISYQYCAHRAAQLLKRNLDDLKLIVCHIGNGASIAAIQNGHSIDTTMGFTPLEGLMMGSRSGSIDPGILIHLLRHEGFTADTLDSLLNKSSGLKGLSGISSDMREVESAIEQDNSRAQLAWDVYVHRLRCGIGAMLAALQGADAIVFTGGIGENNAKIRAQACEAFKFIGWELDPQKNSKRPIDQDIALPDSTARILVIQTQEDWSIAQETQRIVSKR